MSTFGEELYYSLVEVVKTKPEKFFMNIHEYKGKRLVMFDYSLVIPNDFYCSAALEARGSLFEVDENNNFVAVVALPFEKFFNLHEFDFDNTELSKVIEERYGVRCNSETIKSLPNGVWMDKRDGSIITAFAFNATVDMKSNSSLTSDYKFEALNILRDNNLLYQKTKSLTDKGYSVMFEYTSSNPNRQIVLEYDEDRLIVTGARSNHDGSYITHENLVNHFGQDNVVDLVEGDYEDFTKQGIEGYVVWYQEYGLRVKFKMEEYLTLHRVKSNVTIPNNVWINFIKGNLDDISASIKSENIKQFLVRFGQQSNDLYVSIVEQGTEIYNKCYHEDRKTFFTNIEAYKSNDEATRQSVNYAKNLYLLDNKQAIERLHDSLVQNKTIAKLGVSFWK